MAKRDRIVRYSADELATLRSETDWARVDATTPEAVERQAMDDDGPLPDGWENTVVLGVPEPKQDVHIRLDPAVLRWFKAQGPGYQTRINAVLRGFVESRQRAAGGGDGGPATPSPTSGRGR
jgi:uncharacterized protein (DUF4415 family)